MHGICHLALIALRADASERAELASQLLFGETYTIAEIADKWVKIETCDCHYEGWIDKKLVCELPDAAAKKQAQLPKFFLRNLVQFIHDDARNITFPIFAGSTLPMADEKIYLADNQQFTICRTAETDLIPCTKNSADVNDMLRFAAQFLNAPYLWGGRTMAGIDCSAFVQLMLKSGGILLPRDASQQVHCGETIDFIEEVQRGDVAFFHNDNGDIVHTGVIFEAGNERKIIHASGCVRVDSIDSTGIFNRERQKYSHFLRTIKRMN